MTRITKILATILEASQSLRADKVELGVDGLLAILNETSASSHTIDAAVTVCDTWQSMDADEKSAMVLIVSYLSILLGA